MTPNETQQEAAFKIRQALLAAGLSEHAKVGYTGAESHEPYDGASADFEVGDGGRRVHCYRDEDGAWMIDAMDANVGVPAPAPFSHGLLIAYLVWATGVHDESFGDLDTATFGAKLQACPECFRVSAAGMDEDGRSGGIAAELEAQATDGLPPLPAPKNLPVVPGHFPVA